MTLMDAVLRMSGAVLILCFAALLLSSSALAESDPMRQAYRSMIASADYADQATCVIGHKNPDSDSTCAAIACASLLNQLGISAFPAAAGPLNGETAYLLSRFGIDPPDVMTSAGDGQFFLVDHSSAAQAITGMNKAKIVGVVDHHGPGGLTSGNAIYIKCAPAGSTCSLVYLMYAECGARIDRDMARLMLSGILSDTRGLTRQVTPIDQLAVDALKPIADIGDIDELYRAMTDALAAYGGMSDEEIFFADYKQYEVDSVSYAISDVIAFGDEAARELAERMRTVMNAQYARLGLDMLYTIVHDRDNGTMLMIAMGDGAQALLERTYGNFDGEKYFLFTRDLSRRMDVAPSLACEIGHGDR